MIFSPFVPILYSYFRNEKYEETIFDMDGVLVDFQSGIDKLSEETKHEYEGRLDEVLGVFSLMDTMPGAIETVHELSKHNDVYSFLPPHGRIRRHGATRSVG